MAFGIWNHIPFVFRLSALPLLLPYILKKKILQTYNTAPAQDTQHPSLIGLTI